MPMLGSSSCIGWVIQREIGLGISDLNSYDVGWTFSIRLYLGLFTKL